MVRSGSCFLMPEKGPPSLTELRARENRARRSHWRGLTSSWDCYQKLETRGVTALSGMVAAGLMAHHDGETRSVHLSCRCGMLRPRFTGTPAALHKESS